MSSRVVHFYFPTSGTLFIPIDNYRNQCIGVTLVSPLDVDMGNQVQGLGFFFRVIGVRIGFHHLDLIPLAFMPTLTGIRVRRIL